MRDGPVTELHWLGVAEAAGAIAAKELSPVELMKALLERIDALDPQLNAFIRLDGEAALQAAKAAEAEATRGPAARAAARRAGRHQGHHRRRRPADDLPFQDPAGQPRDRRRRLRRKAARRRRDRGRQALDARIRDRRAELRPAVAAGAQSVEPRPSSRRLVVGLGLGRVGRPVPDGAGQRHRRQRAQSGELLRHRRPEADLRPGVAARRLPALLHPRPYRADDAHGRRQRADAGGDRRPRSARSRQRGRAERPLCGGLERAVRDLRVGFIRHFHEIDMPAEPEVTAALEHVARTLQLRGRRGARRPSADAWASSARSIASSCKARPGRSTVAGCASGPATTASSRAAA